MPNPKPYPSEEMLEQLEAAGWTKCSDGLFWQSPYNQYYFSPPGAVVEEEKKNPTNA